MTHEMPNTPYHPAVGSARINFSPGLLGFRASPYFLEGFILYIPKREVHPITLPDIAIGVHLKGVRGHSTFHGSLLPIHMVDDSLGKKSSEPVFWVPRF